MDLRSNPRSKKLYEKFRPGSGYNPETLIFLSKKLKGFIQAAHCDQHLQISLHSDLQLKELNKIPKKNRILHIDSTDKLVNIPRYMNAYTQIMNYTLLVEDASDLETFSLMKPSLQDITLPVL